MVIRNTKKFNYFILIQFVCSFKIHFSFLTGITHRCCEASARPCTCSCCCLASSICCLCFSSCDAAIFFCSSWAARSCSLRLINWLIMVDSWRSFSSSDSGVPGQTRREQCFNDELIIAAFCVVPTTVGTILLTSWWRVKKMKVCLFCSYRYFTAAPFLPESLCIFFFHLKRTSTHVLDQKPSFP